MYSTVQGAVKAIIGNKLDLVSKLPCPEHDFISLKLDLAFPSLTWLHGTTSHSQILQMNITLTTLSRHLLLDGMCVGGVKGGGLRLAP